MASLLAEEAARADAEAAKASKNAKKKARKKAARAASAGVGEAAVEISALQLEPVETESVAAEAIEAPEAEGVMAAAAPAVVMEVARVAVPTAEVPKTVQPKKTPGMKQTLAREATQAPPAAASTPEDVSTEAVAQVLMDFCQTDFAKQMCEYCSISPTEFGQLSSMFESVRVEQRKIVVRLNRRFEQRSEKLLDRLVKYLRTEMPQLKQLQYEVRSPPTTRTFIIS